ncbi:MAG: carbohydrate binding family 9 domain-containing protein [Lewinellaceae bacterium]|nr:carbohydrate binding family 9 domain-containing protein [Lewinellaceae bacterium]
MNRLFFFVLLLVCCSWGLSSYAQNIDPASRAQPAIQAKRTMAKPVLDGQVNEELWFRGRPAKDFWQLFPSDSVRCPAQTEIYISYDDEFLYLAAICYTTGNDYVIPSLRRDFRAGGNDNITFVFDSYNDRTNAFVFGMNPYGVMREALIANGGRERDDFNENWDNKWSGASFRGDKFWSCELAIPFGALRFKENMREWNFNSYRFDTQTNTQSTWSWIPQNQLIMSLAFMNKIEWEEPLKKAGSSVAIIPYITGATSTDFEAQEPAMTSSNIGGDAKIALSPSLNLDLTVNPDFSQVEVDRQVINLDRFEIFFPERRQFFLENADLFSGFGDQRINPFFSRRIGIGRDTADNVVQIPILYGARLSGKLDNNWRVGLLNMHTQLDRDGGIPGANYTVAAVQRKLFSRSNIGLIFVDKENFANDLDIASDEMERYNRVIGLDYNLASSDNRWNGKFFYHQLFNPDTTHTFGDKFAHGGNLSYQDRFWRFEYEQNWVRDGYEPSVGFVPRNNFFSIRNGIRHFFYPTKGAINRYSLGLRSRQIWQPVDGKTDHQYSFSWDVDLKNTGGINADLNHNYVYLFDEFDPTRSDGTPLAAGTEYNYVDFSISYRSDQRKVISYRLEPGFGQYFNGTRYSLQGGLTWRYQPLGFIELNFNFNHIDLPAPYSTATLFLIGPRIDLTLSKSIFLTTFLQYNSQVDNLNINARLQWRFAPVSDFFLVYTDNYNTTDFGVKNRAIVAKMTYWLNL